MGSTIVEADIEFNEYYAWSASTSCPSGYIDVQTVALHELGHWVGLADLYSAGDAAKVMYGYSYSGTTKRALTADDIAGIQSIYGASGSGGAEKLIGVAADAIATGTAGSCTNVMMQRFLATATGSITEFKVKASASGNVKVAIYSDSSGQPNSRLAAVSSTPVTTGWNTIPVTSSIDVTSGAYYWLAVVSDSCNIYYHFSDPSANTVWKPSNYSSWNFPDPAGSGWNLQPGSTHFIAAWGTTTPPTPPNPPDLLSPGTAITFKWGAPNGATKYQLQVSTSSSFTTTVFDADVGNNTLQEVTGLSLDTLYYWRVRAGNDGGWGNWSTTRSVTVNQVP
jgi:hypothetical protein